jgi:hypothetical protein
MPLPASGTERDRSFKSYVESPTRGSDGTAQEVFIGNADDITISFEETIAQQILKASDRNKQFTWLDFGTRNERVSSIVYTAPSVGSYILTKTFSYSLSGNAYRLDSEILVLT